MANISNEPHDQPDAPAMDYPEHERTFNAFITATKWSIGILAILMIALFFIIRP